MWMPAALRTGVTPFSSASTVQCGSRVIVFGGNWLSKTNDDHTPVLFIDIPADTRAVTSLPWNAYINVSLPWYSDSATSNYNTTHAFIFGGYRVGVGTHFTFTNLLMAFDSVLGVVTQLAVGPGGPSPRAGVACAVSRDTL